MFVIQPSHPWWKSGELVQATKLPEGFRIRATRMTAGDAPRTGKIGRARRKRGGSIANLGLEQMGAISTKAER
jgi:hypothetical protein